MSRAIERAAAGPLRLVTRIARPFHVSEGEPTENGHVDDVVVSFDWP
jgi:hypothetical protein